jgi:hypothetical protein
MDRRLVGALIVLGVVALVVGVVAFFVVSGANRSALLAAHKGRVQEYLKVSVGVRAPEDYLKGKVITVDTGLEDIDEEVFFALPAALRADRPEEVDTVVFLQWEISPFVGPAGCEYTCRMTAVEKATQIVTAKKEFRRRTGPDADKPEDRIAGKPSAAVAEFLAGLPRR